MGTKLNMASGIREFARASPRRVAVVDGDRQLTFAGLDDRSNRLATALLAQGVRKGDRVAVLSANRLEYFEIATALAKIGVAMVPLNSRNSAEDNAFIIRHSRSRTLLLDPALAAGAELVLDELDLVLAFDGGGDVGRDYDTFVAQGRATDAKEDIGGEDIFCITYTSGTTGRPKGVLLTHTGRTLTGYATALEYGLGPTRNTMAVAPMYHGAGFAFGYAGPQFGGTTEVLRSWDPEQFLRMLERSRTSTVFLVPTHAQQIRRICESPASAYDLSALQTLYFNAAALPVELKKWVHEAFPGVGVHELYGSTECSVVTDLRPEDSLRKAGSVGHPWFMNEVKLLDDAGQEVAPGVPGSSSPARRCS
ncbi:AMP-binding protein [Nocardioides alcanivorans]|uniref:AMP-binding protein n=1 Tax=Nocardioides alcanivorans TaxID=2897352 RepID=UPI0035D70245